MVNTTTPFNSSQDVLSSNQQNLLQLFGGSDLSTHFYLTGGTALSAFYLRHRYSDDLLFFTLQKQNVELIRKEIADVFSSFGGVIHIIRSLETFVEAHYQCSDGEIIKMDFAYDSPFRHHDTELSTEYQIRIDSLLDIGCNKISTVFDRGDMKDFVDLFFLLKEYFSFEELWDKAKQKHIGLDEYWFCQSLIRVTQLKHLPRMIKPLSIEAMNIFFLDLHNQIFTKISG